MMTLLRLSAFAAPVVLIFTLVVTAFSASLAGSSSMEVQTRMGDYTLNSILLEGGPEADLPPIVFIHGASASLYDSMYSFRDALEGRADLLFIDRPGHGKSSSRGPRSLYPDGQADAIAELMDARGIGKAIIVSHSFGGSVAAALALNHKDKVLGLLFLSPAVYPWPGGIAWYYDVASAPVAGWLFSTLIAPPAGLLAMDQAIKSVFAPNPRPKDYVRKAKAFQAIRPAAFRHNAMEIANLLEWTKQTSPRYPEIKAPTVIITGDTDDIVSPEIHSHHLARAISGARLFTIHGLGHKSDYVARALAVAAIETLAGKHRDLDRLAKETEKRIADERGG